jgi:hypothetical protein
VLHLIHPPCALARIKTAHHQEPDFKKRDFQIDELLDLMMKKELGEITQEIFMERLKVLKKQKAESKKKV